MPERPLRFESPYAVPSARVEPRYGRCPTLVPSRGLRQTRGQYIIRHHDRTTDIIRIAGRDRSRRGR
jgi:hypothetical protein